MSDEQNTNTLYLCYFGLREPLVQTQVLPYLREIKKMKGLKASLLTFEPDFKEKWNDADVAAEKEKLAAENIDWYALPYHKSPSVPATLYDIFCGAKLARKLIKEKNISILHARSHVPAVMGALAKASSREKIKLIFDIRGFFPEEYTDAGRWKENGRLYHSVKKVEKWLLKKSDAFIVLTEKARQILFPESKETGFDKQGRPVEVIPCCVNLKKFDIDFGKARREIREKFGAGNRQVIAYVGSFGGYYLTKETADFYRIAKARDSETFALILTQSDPEMILPLLRESGYQETDYFIKKVKPAEIPHYLSAADYALSFIKPSYSKLASSPTKNAEYLACGLPIIANSNVGDTAEQIIEHNLGVVVDDFSDEVLTAAYEKIKQLDDISERCRRSAIALFDLEKIGGEKYRRIYRDLLFKDSK